MKKYLFLFIMSPVAALADAVQDINRVVHQIFPKTPPVQFVDDLTGLCGFGSGVNKDIAYCTSQNVVFIRKEPKSDMREAYELAHVMGHAVQVKYGVADIALRKITDQRDRETELRGMVTRQVECIAGVLFTRAGLPRADLKRLYKSEPFTDSHWGREPLRIGPKVSIGLGARAEWFSKGQQTAQFESCTVGEISANLIVQAAR
ncbi:hypothetical protein F9L33_02120 [Amylibacter sp. SFDW26]|uniref:hypothetical protein n=1 Tax=Amylibacter sp. SFDW26 TaxID=2652722 RepID=UPI001261B5E0|nr:hypothetical protein [Amylibacter sp. SFDW26]KAB7615580.1 hypothetical protein F9L33_02120 [Amylibacter sp. SFDW26]